VTKLNKCWALITISLVVIIATGGIVIWRGYSGSQPVEISIPPSNELQGKIYISGMVNTPGFYPLSDGDSVGALVQAAGGITDNADVDQLKFHIPELGGQAQPQKIDINRAEVWLLQALPGIGETRAQAIVDYRQQNGTFHNINELTKVQGIGTATYEEIKSLITVAD